MFTKKFLEDTAERVLITMAEAFIAVWGVDRVSALEADWYHITGIVLGAGALSLAKCLYARRRGDSEKASLVQ